MFALDTNTVIYLLKGLGRVPENFLRASPLEVSIPSVVIYELETGIAKSRQPERTRAPLAELLSKVIVLPFGVAEATASARIRAILEGQGSPIGPIDNLIAGTVLAQSATLVTHNVREFGRVPGLPLVDWYSAWPT